MRHLLLTFLLILSWNLIAAPAIDEQYSITNLNLKNGLSNDFVTDIEIDGKGSVWIATESGLNRLSAAGNTIYNTGNSDIPSNKINALFHHSSTGRIFIATGKGLAVYDARSARFHTLTTADGLSENIISHVTGAADGDIWITYFSKGVAHIDPESLTIKNYSPASLQKASHGSMDDGLGSLYIGHRYDGMSILDIKSGKVRNFTHNPSDPGSLPSNNVRVIKRDNMDDILVGTNNGMAIFDPDNGTFSRMDIAGIHGTERNIYDICTDIEGNIWVAGYMDGIIVLEASKIGEDKPSHAIMSQFDIKDSDANVGTKTITTDDFGNIWIGSYGRGLDMLSPRDSEFTTLHPRSDDGHGNPVYSLAYDNQGNLWAGGDTKISLMKNDKPLKEWSLAPLLGYSSVLVYIIYPASDGRIWLGCDDEGVVRFNPATEQFSTINLGHKKIDIHAFHEDADSTILIGSELGLYSYRNGVVRQEESINRQLHSSTIYGIMRDRQGKLWVGTHGGGVDIFDRNGRRTAHLGEYDKSLPSNDVNQLFMDTHGSIWIPTSDGIVRVKDTRQPSKTEIFGYADGLTESHIRAVQEDFSGKIWISTYAGVALLDPDTGKIRNFDFNDGVPAGAFMEGSATISPDGNVYFGSPKGICRISADNADIDEAESKVNILQCDGIDPDEKSGARTLISADKDGHIVLPSSQNTIKIYYGIADMAKGANARYSYMLEGLDDKWHDAGNETDVTFRNLDPGRYTFKVKARLKNGEWNHGNMASLKITVEPPLYATWYMKILYLLIAAAIILSIIRFYKRKLKMESTIKLQKASLELEKDARQKEQDINNERLQFYTNIAHELRTPLTLILGPLEDLKKDKHLPAPYSQKIGIIHNSSIRLLNLINSIMEFRKTETHNKKLAVARGDLGKLVTEIGLRYKEPNRNDNVKITVDVCPCRDNACFDREVVSTILNNLLSNAFKYTPKGEISLTMRPVYLPEGEAYSIKVTDTGYGIPKDALPRIFDRYYQVKGKHQASGTGIGLALVKSLAELHHGSVTAESTPGKGSTFTFTLPVSCTLYGKPDDEAVQAGDAKTTATVTDDNTLSEDIKPILLVVEDNDDIRDYIASEFSSDFTVMQATNGKEGLKVARDTTPDIIVSDIMMPEMDGIEFCSILNNHILTSHIPVILLPAKDVRSE